MPPVILQSQLPLLKNFVRIELIKRFAAAGDVLNWGKTIMPEKFPLPFCQELHGHLVDTRKSSLVAIEAPRGHAKTQIGCVLIPLFMALNDPEAFRHYLNVQSNDDKALVVNRSIKAQIESNEFVKHIYGNQVGDRWTDASFALKNGVAFSAAGSGASIRGINFNGVRPDYVICDDLYDTDADANSPVSTEKKNAWFWSTLFPAMAQDRPTAMHFQGTAVNRYDLFEKMKADPNVGCRTFRAVDWENRTVLWKGLKTVEDFERMREHMGSLIFSREFQNERRDDASSIIKLDWLYPASGEASWEYDPTTLRFDLEKMLYAGAVVTLDPSIGGKKQSDKSGYAVIMKGQPANGGLPVFYIEALVNELHSFQERVDTMRRLTTGRAVERPITRARVETISGFKDIGEKIAQSVAVPCDLVDHVPNKLTNLERHSALFENHRVFLNRDISPNLRQELSYQLTSNNPKHDDLRDAVLLGLDADAAVDWSTWL